MTNINHLMKKKIMILLDVLVLLLLITNLSACNAKQEDSEPPEIEINDQAKEEYMRAIALFEEGLFYSAKEAFENSSYEDYQQRALDCIQTMPQTGEIWHDENMISDNMRLDFITFEEDENIGRYIAVYTKENNLVETIFIQGSGTVETWIPSGTYCIKDASGTTWFGEKELFGKEGKYETMLFNENDENPHLTTLRVDYIWTITINSLNNTGGEIGSQEDDWESWNH